MHQCMRVWETMKTKQSENLFSPPPPPPVPFAGHKRKSQDGLDDQMAPRPPSWPAPASSPWKPINTTQPGNLVPSPNGFSGPPSAPSPTTALPKRRGRPPRIDIEEARTRQKALHPTGYAPIAPVPGQTVVLAEGPRKKGRRSTAGRLKQPKHSPRKITAPGGLEIRSHEEASPTSPATDPKEASDASRTASLGLTEDTQNEGALKVSHVLA